MGYRSGTIVVCLLGLALCWQCTKSSDSPSNGPRAGATRPIAQRINEPRQAKATLRRGKELAPRRASASSPARTRAGTSQPLKLPRSKAESPGSANDLPWTTPGQCTFAEAQGERVAYFSEFVQATDAAEIDEPERTQPLRIWTDPEVPQAALAQVRAALVAARSFAAYYKEDLEPPDVYLHRNVEELRKHACVAESALSYYDGSLHIAMMDSLDEVETSIRHEYAHHLLTKLGFGRPVWLQEGFAQRFAGETTGSGPLSKKALDLAAMVEPLSTKSTEEHVAAFYAQSSDMLEFLNQLPSSTGKRGYVALLFELSQALTQGTTTPEDLFVWAMMERGRTVTTGDPVAFWEEYLASGGFDEGR